MPTRTHDAVGGAEGAGGDVPEAQPHQRTTVVSDLLLPVPRPRLAGDQLDGGEDGTPHAQSSGEEGKKTCSLQLTKSIVDAQFRSNVHNCTQGWTVFHLPSTPTTLGSPNAAASWMLPAATWGRPARLANACAGRAALRFFDSVRRRPDG